MVGSTGDPATPYEWARSLADQLDTGRLLTREGNGHVAYGRAAACTQLVDTDLLTGERPSPRRVCRDETYSIRGPVRPGASSAAVTNCAHAVLSFCNIRL